MSQVALLAILVLEDGTIFHGKSIGASGDTVDEVVLDRKSVV